MIKLASVVNVIEKVQEFLKKIGLYISNISILIMMVLIMVDVIIRNFFEIPFAGAYDLVESYLMPLTVFPAIAFAYSSGILPRLGELILKFPVKVQKVAEIIIDILELVIFALLTYYSYKFAMTGLADQMSIPFGGNLYPLYPIFFLLPFGFGLVVIEVILDMVKKYLKIEVDAKEA